jgi:glycosyltransferase involved in cell wall biosynthesis
MKIMGLTVVHSGVGTQTRYIIEGLLKTGKFKIISLGGAIKHKEYRPQKVEEFGDDWIILPINGYGDENMIRQLLDMEKPDAIWFMTDPRFFTWLFAMSDEIRDRNIPLLYYHVWDNYPVPDFNKPFYNSCDFIGCISKLTHNIICELGMKKNSAYIPHAVNYDIFRQFTNEEIQNLRKEKVDSIKNKFIVFYNSRNARRKMTSDIIKQYKMFLDQVGQDEAFFLLHTDPKDPEGGDLEALCHMLKLTPKQIMFSNMRLPPEEMANLYNIADVTINMSNNEGFGLSSLESLACGTPVISNRTGGLQDQNIMEDGTELGVSIKPATRTLVGSQQIPYILDDRCSDEDVILALMKMYKMDKEERVKLGTKSAKHIRDNFSMEILVNGWYEAITQCVTKFKKEGYENRIKFEEI